MAKLFVVVLTAIVAVCTSSSIREKRQIDNYFSCPSGNGLYPDQSNCEWFYECDQGIAYRKPCPAKLYFNPSTSQCDWPYNVQNRQCQGSAGSQINSVCQMTAGASLAPHPEFCNAFMMCGNGYLHDGCQFCAQGQYFDAISRSCVQLYNVDVLRVCQNKQMIDPVDQTIRLLSPSCYPSNPDIYAPLIAKYERERGVYRPNHNNNNNNNNIYYYNNNNKDNTDTNGNNYNPYYPKAEHK